MWRFQSPGHTGKWPLYCVLQKRRNKLVSRRKNEIKKKHSSDKLSDFTLHSFQLVYVRWPNSFGNRNQWSCDEWSVYSVLLDGEIISIEMLFIPEIGRFLKKSFKQIRWTVVIYSYLYTLQLRYIFLSDENKDWKLEFWIFPGKICNIEFVFNLMLHRSWHRILFCFVLTFWSGQMSNVVMRIAHSPKWTNWMQSHFSNNKKTQCKIDRGGWDDSVWMCVTSAMGWWKTVVIGSSALFDYCSFL